METEKNNAYYSELAERAVNDMKAFDELYEHFFRIVYNMVYFRVKNADTADDITSDIFLKATRNLKNFDSRKASFATWISRITVSVCTDYFRTNGKTQESSWDDTFGLASDSKEQPEQQFILNENKKLLLKALETLSEREQKIIEMMFWFDMTHVEIAEVLALTPSNVGIILHRAITALKKKLPEKDKFL